MRESVAAALNSSHLEWKHCASAIEKVAALGKAPVLGSLLWRVKYGNQGEFYGELLERLCLKLRASKRFNWGRENRRMIAGAVLMEWLADQCLACGGTGNQFYAELKDMCRVCAGTGKRRFSDGTRAQKLGIALERYRAENWGKRFNEVLGLISAVDISTATAVRRELEM